MGYWSDHPLGGDAPLDEESALLRALATHIHFPGDPDWIPGHTIAENLETFVDLPCEPGMDFVKPFLIAERGIRVADPKLSARLKAMIGDGGAAGRGYDPGEDESPELYARQLHEAWDRLMAGTQGFDSLARNKGLLEVFAEHLS